MNILKGLIVLILGIMIFSMIAHPLAIVTAIAIGVIVFSIVTHPLTIIAAIIGGTMYTIYKLHYNKEDK